MPQQKDLETLIVTKNKNKLSAQGKERKEKMNKDWNIREKRNREREKM